MYLKGILVIIRCNLGFFGVYVVSVFCYRSFFFFSLLKELYIIIHYQFTICINKVIAKYKLFVILFIKIIIYEKQRFYLSDIYVSNLIIIQSLQFLKKKKNPIPIVTKILVFLLAINIIPTSNRQCNTQHMCGPSCSQSYSLFYNIIVNTYTIYKIEK